MISPLTCRPSPSLSRPQSSPDLHLRLPAPDISHDTGPEQTRVRTCVRAGSLAAWLPGFFHPRDGATSPTPFHPFRRTWKGLVQRSARLTVDHLSQFNGHLLESSTDRRAAKSLHKSMLCFHGGQSITPPPPPLSFPSLSTWLPPFGLAHPPQLIARPLTLASGLHLRWQLVLARLQFSRVFWPWFGCCGVGNWEKENLRSGGVEGFWPVYRIGLLPEKITRGRFVSSVGTDRTPRRQ